jgi:hypothetical protein
MTTASSAQNSLMLVESARYALLRRLAHAMRHQMVVHLQPIGMVTELLERRLRAATPDLGQVQDGVGKISHLSKAAVQDCLSVIAWMSPEPGGTIALDAGVQEIMALLRSNFSFRGFNLRSEVEAMPQPVGHAAVRMLVPGALLALADTTPAPADLVLSASRGEDVVHLDIRVGPGEGDASLAGELPYRPLGWHEVEAMARSEDVDLLRTAEGGRLTFPVLD